MNNKSKFLVQGGVVAALYVVLTYLCSLMGLSSGVIQVRFSEAMCILPCFMPASVPGLFLGCFLSNLLTGCVMWDVIFGSLATLLGAIGTYLLRKNRFLACIPPIIANVLIIPFVLIYAYEVPDTYWFLVITIAAGEIISCGILGQILYSVISKNKSRFS
ncbi:MAG: QueT transporter family protein [Lachnospiraceae bacterium]|nr:QueT transporter family protein [Lachnospiraceae bacterium]